MSARALRQWPSRALSEEYDSATRYVRFHNQIFCQNTDSSSDDPGIMRLRGGGDDPHSDAEGDDESAASADNRDDQDEDEEESHGNGLTNGTALRNAVSSVDFQPGAIVRVCVDNFVTYEHAEFHPGPNLNMVIGPNGTGKSSLVCAICLGLGYHSNVLGRASSFGEFVKHGKDTAEIEVELQKRPRDQSNWTVKLEIRREDNSRKFWINGQQCRQKDMAALTKKLRIQIDNLCQFLPQDKVAEFAGLTPIDLLNKTLQAAAPPEVMEWQDDLKDVYKARSDVQRQAEADDDTLQALERRQQAMQADVERVREREAIQKTIADLRALQVFVAYEEARQAFNTAKQERNAATARYQQLQQESGPALRAIEQKQNYQQAVESVLENRKQILRTEETTAEKLLSEIEGLDEKLKGFDTRRSEENGVHKNRRQEIMFLRQKITARVAEYKSQPQAFHAQEWNTNIRAGEHAVREVEAEMRELDTSFQSTQMQGKEKKEEIRKIERDLNSLDSQQGRQVNHLRSVAPDVYQGWEWLQKHQGEFEKEVFGPPMLTCSVKDDRYSDLVQALLQRDDFFCFTAQTKEDHKKLSDQFFGKMGLSATIRTCMNPFSSFRKPMTVEELNQLALDGFAIDYLEGPETVLAMLCAERRLHTAGLGLNDVDNDQYERIVQREVISHFAAGRQYYRVTRRREYGPHAVSTTTRNVMKAVFWTDQPVDNAAKDELSRRLIECKAEFDGLKQQHESHKQKRVELESRQGDIMKRIDVLKRDKAELQKEYNLWQALPGKIDALKREVEEKRESLADIRARVHTIEDNWDQAMLDKAKAVLRLQEQLGVIRDAQKSLVDAQVRLVEAKSDVEGLMERNQDISRQLDEVKEQESRLREDVAKAREVARRYHEEVGEIIGEQPERRAEWSARAQERTTEHVANELSAEEAKLELIHDANPDVLRNYERQGADIEKMQRKKVNTEQKLENLEKKITSLRSKFEPRLDELISKINDAFSYNFEQISCAGEVGVHKDEEFDKWAIEIKVKFRENETLQILDKQRQSGGERAVSTIFYLMSLQSMAQAPFRVVDEINQGMDPRNERMVHERMVEIACHEHTSQYFLITPKLLSGLKYDERMRVLCIASGEYMPPEGRKLDFRECIRVQRRLMAASA